MFFSSALRSASLYSADLPPGWSTSEVAIRCYLIPLLQVILPQNHAGNDAIEKGLGKEGYPSPFMEKPGEG
jgi:hypothetical protein